MGPCGVPEVSVDIQSTFPWPLHVVCDQLENFWASLVNNRQRRGFSISKAGDCEGQ